MTIEAYLEIINKRFKTGISREHTYRGDLQTLLMTLLPNILVTNEPSRVDCGAPDYVLTKKDIPVGYIEAKDIGVDLNSKTLKEQFDRYRSGLSNLIFTDYIDFHFYKDGVFITKIAIAKIDHGSIAPIPENFESFELLIKNFALTVSQTIKSPTKLAEMMAGKAKLMADVIEKSLNHDDETETRSAIKSQMLSFKQMLIHDINNTAFADIYAQTIAYGMFAARYHDPTLPTFSRQEAATLIPKSNPFLRKLFQDIAGFDLDDRLIWIVDELVNIFLATDVADIMRNFGKSTKQEDPVVHFYETFLATYNPALRKARGVWYTPQPVVNFIVRAVDDILKTEFNLPQGLADTSKVKIKTKAFTKATSDRRSNVKEVEVEREVHKVQILDPATGTGTFLAEVIKHIYKKFEGQQGIWSNYVSQHLIPRLNGFELLMASYAMAHLKMDMLLTETGYKAKDEQRFRIFLTNSLEESHPDSGTLFSSWLSDEADQANTIKRDTPVMVIMGNPPYSVSSTNRSPWIEKLVSDYKVDLNERNIQPLSDDYIKFIRFGQHFIDKNGEGVLAYISNNSFLDGVIHRKMRMHLMRSFNKMYILDLHGSLKRRETSDDGGKDENVFDIQQGVSINIFIKNGNSSNEIFNYDLRGKRDDKYQYLQKNAISTIDWKPVKSVPENYAFTAQNVIEFQQYTNNLFSVTELFKSGSNGVQTKRDSLFVDFKENVLKDRISTLLSGQLTSNFINEYQIEDSSSYPLLKRILNSRYDSTLVSKFSYRPLDTREVYYDKNLLGRPFYKMLRNVHKKDNLCLIIGRQGQAVGDSDWNLVFIANQILDTNLFYRGGNMAYPLYLYSEESNQIKTNKDDHRVPNMELVIVKAFEKSIKSTFKFEETLEPLKEKSKEFYPINILDYIYAILHSPFYREKYKEFLKTDYPRIPYPVNANQFFQLADLGKKIRELHLLESDKTEKYITQYPEDGDNNVIKPNYKDGKVYINETQYFANVPEIAWNFYIGGYQPAQKWLKDRKGRTLYFEDILHYQKIIVALNRTAEIMIEIDKVLAL